MILETILFFASILFAPWYVAVLVGCYLLGRHNAWFSVMLGALVADTLFGAPIAVLYGFQYMYMAIFAILAFATFYLRATILE